MTRYAITAWCVRPFISYLDEVEAETPEEAIALARRQPEKLLDAAEECNGQYLWDEFAAYDEDGTELLRVLDAEARVRDAAPELLAACRMVVGRWESGDLAEAARACSSAVELARAGDHYAAEISACQAAESVACYPAENDGGNA